MTIEIATDVVMDHAMAATPKSAWAQKLAAQAKQKAEAERKQGGIKDLASGRQDMFRVNPYTLRVKPGWNSREANDPDNIAHIDWLARSIASEGVLTPLTVFWEDGTPVVEDGHCRLLGVFRAIEHYGAEIPHIPVQVTDRHRSEADRVLSQLNRNSGKQLTPFEAAKVYARLHRLGWTVDEIATRTAKSKGYIEGLLQLQAAPAEVQKHVISGAVSTTLATKVLKSNDGNVVATAAALDAAVDAAKAKGKARATERHVRATGGAVPKSLPTNTSAQGNTSRVIAPPPQAQPKPQRETASPMSDTDKLARVRNILDRAKWNDTPRRGEPVRAEIDADEYTELRELVGF